jgi:predicted dehydrogenase
MVNTLGMSNSKNSNESRQKVKIGIVGCGVVATAYYLPFIIGQEDAELVAVCDSNPKRTVACARLFGAREQYTDYYEMIAKGDIEAVFILTGPGTHASFTLAAVEAGKHILLQKPMALTVEDTNKIVDAVRKHKVKALVEPSSDSPLDPMYPPIRQLIRDGALGELYWFSWMAGAPSTYGPGLGGNPYGVGAFHAKDSGGMLLDFPYAPTQIVSLLGSCKSVTGTGKISIPDRQIVPDSEYDKFLEAATDPQDANYWNVVLDLPKTQHVKMEAPDNVFSTYEMDNGCIGVFHIARPIHPMPPGASGGGFRIYGTEGNLSMGGNSSMFAMISTRKDLLPHTDENGWYNVPYRKTEPSKWPIPAKGSFNYYHESTRHLIDCILNDTEPYLSVEWGRHITEMMVGALLSAETGQRYEMTTTLEGLR